MKLRPKIDGHDYETKKGHVVRFLRGGDKVKITIMFRGREQSRPELGFNLLRRLAEDVSDDGCCRAVPEAGGAQYAYGVVAHPQEERCPRRPRG
ncbi:translation initiation factor IF-3 [Propionibacterium freudenreichii]|uniref:translation initiation factor IF-3 n=1 Tax=Propionibacterium freudenreichii TaxID=1744 RepID=UPI00254FFFBD|nr:translation initiation factor IF-3 [Propionibacterium freudenreichii]